MNRLRYDGMQQGVGDIDNFLLLTIIDPSHPRFNGTFSHKTLLGMGFPFSEILDAVVEADGSL